MLQRLLPFGDCKGSHFFLASKSFSTFFLPSGFSYSENGRLLHESASMYEKIRNFNHRRQSLRNDLFQSPLQFGISIHFRKLLELVYAHDNPDTLVD